MSIQQELLQEKVDEFKEKVSIDAANSATGEAFTIAKGEDKADDRMFFRAKLGLIYVRFEIKRQRFAPMPTNTRPDRREDYQPVFISIMMYSWGSDAYYPNRRYSKRKDKTYNWKAMQEYANIYHKAAVDRAKAQQKESDRMQIDTQREAAIVTALPWTVHRLGADGTVFKFYTETGGATRGDLTTAGALAEALGHLPPETELDAVLTFLVCERGEKDITGVIDRMRPLSIFSGEHDTRTREEQEAEA